MAEEENDEKGQGKEEEQKEKHKWVNKRKYIELSRSISFYK